MARGGARPGAGRKKGTITSPRKAAIIEAGRAAALEGETPLAYMLRIMRTSNDDKRRDAMAVAAAAFVHPRLSNIEANVKVSEHEEAVKSLHAVVASSSADEHERPN